MATFTRLHQQILRSRRLPLLGIALTLGILAGTVSVGALLLRGKIRAQIAGRDAAILHAVALMQQVSQESEQELGGQVEEVTDQFAILLHVSQLNGVIAARLFDADGKYQFAFPVNTAEASLDAQSLGSLRELRPFSRYRPRANPAGEFIHGTTPLVESKAPLLEVVVPLHRRQSPRLAGAIQFIIDGRSIATEYTALDQNLVLQGGIVFLAGGAVIVLALGWAFRKLQRTGRLLLDRTETLARANAELALAAKTSAVGAVAAHLIHGLSNPLAGLQDFVASRRRDTLDESDWKDAITTAEQMRHLLAEVVRIIADEQSVDRYDISLKEWTELLARKVAPVAEAAGVVFDVRVTQEGVLLNREANLSLLIIENLVTNALQATPRGRNVRLRLGGSGDAVVFEVEDEGPGIAAGLEASLFKPCRSTKPCGNGIGLAICKQLASHLGAELLLTRNTPRGCLFRLTLPRVRPPGVLPLVQQPGPG